MEVWTIKKLLEWVTGYFEQKGVDAPRLSAELLLCHVLKLERIQLYTLYDRLAEKPQLETLRGLVKRAGEQEPIAYLVGRCEFYSLPLKITPDCLIPRPETEQLAEKAILFLRGRPGPQRALDLCTGSGCIAAAIARSVKDVHVVATDISDKALNVAAENMERLKLTEKVQLLCGDLFDPLITGLDDTHFDLIASNPPYVSDAEYEKLDKNVKDYEPAHALRAGVDGLDVYRRIIAQASDFLKSDGALMMEIGYAQGPAVRQLLDESGSFAEIKIEKDFANNDRIAIAKKHPKAAAQ
ncbi:MAG: peptide chain release factor N(5)-glutamine methyltransferase [Planctomycetaceae bacterium]|nr:peptide chain release factor N(5)-glutamine methyltransferase [Planctomycetaceae bacterium]